jgi:hypothetical protein
MSPRDLESELTKPFALETWTQLLQELLPGLSLFTRPQEIPLVSKAERADAGITDEASAKANFSKVALADMKTLEPTKCGDVEEKTVARSQSSGHDGHDRPGPDVLRHLHTRREKIFLHVLDERRRRSHRRPDQARRITPVLLPGTNS